MRVSHQAQLWGDMAKISSIINWGNPLPLVVGSIASKNAQQLSSIRYMMIVSMSISWYIYGLQTNNSTIQVTSGLGSIVFYIYSMLSAYLRKEYSLMAFFNILIIVESLAVQYLSTDLLGFTCSLVQCLAAMTPIDIILKVMKTKDKSMLNPISLGLNLPCCFLWLGYGLELNEFVIFLPNFIEFVLVFVQTLLYGLLLLKQFKNTPINSKNRDYVKNYNQKYYNEQQQQDDIYQRNSIRYSQQQKQQIQQDIHQQSVDTEQTPILNRSSFYREQKIN